MTAAPRGLPQLIALVCAVHALVLWRGLERRAPIDATTGRPAVLTTRWVAPPPAVQVEKPVQALAIAKRMPARATSRQPSVTTPVAAPSTETDTVTAPPPPDPAPATEAEPALRADGIQRAVRESARRKSLATLAGEQLGQPEIHAETALQNGMAAAARGDCLKGGGGGYAGQGLGLLALPLLAIDLARGHCAK